MKFAQKLAIFFKDSYAPLLHIAYFALLFLSFQGACLLLLGDSWTLSWPSLIGIFYLFSINFLIRAADEIKDFDYDRLHNPDRPLVRGIMTQRDLWIWMVVSGLIGMGANALLSPGLALFAGIHAVYAFTLIAIEKVFPSLGDSLFLSMLITFPINVLMNVYTYYLSAHTQGMQTDPRTLTLLLVLFSAAFLHYEFARKTVFPKHFKEGMRVYSSKLGTKNTVYLSLFLILLAAVGAFYLVWQKSIGPLPQLAWLFVLVPLPFLLKLKAFFKLEDQVDIRKPAALTGPSMQAMALFLIIFLVNALVALPLRFF